jgi:hypothetical protein
MLLYTGGNGGWIRAQRLRIISRLTYHFAITAVPLLKKLSDTNAPAYFERGGKKSYITSTPVYLARALLRTESETRN